MGGLVCKSLLEKEPSVHQSINKIIFLGTPNLGAVESFSTLAHGLESPMIGNTISLDFIQRTETLIDVLNSFNIADAGIASRILDIIDNLNSVINSNDPADCSEIEEQARVILTLIAAVKGILNPASSSYAALISVLDELNRLYGFDKDINFVNDDQLKELTQNLPSAYQLLPSEEYFSHDTDGYYELNETPINMFSDPTMDQTIIDIGNAALYGIVNLI